MNLESPEIVRAFLLLDTLFNKFSKINFILKSLTVELPETISIAGK